MLETNHCKGYFGIRFSFKINVIAQLFFFIAWFGKFYFASSICKTVHLFQNTLFDTKTFEKINLLNFTKFLTITLLEIIKKITIKTFQK